MRGQLSDCSRGAQEAAQDTAGQQHCLAGLCCERRHTDAGPLGRAEVVALCCNGCRLAEQAGGLRRASAPASIAVLGLLELHHACRSPAAANDRSQTCLLVLLPVLPALLQRVRIDLAEGDARQQPHRGQRLWQIYSGLSSGPPPCSQRAVGEGGGGAAISSFGLALGLAQCGQLDQGCGGTFAAYASQSTACVFNSERWRETRARRTRQLVKLRCACKAVAYVHPGRNPRCN